MADKAIPSLLVVEDSSTMRRIIKASLAKYGFTKVTEAGDGNEALQLIQNNSINLSLGIADFDCILTDWNMPNFDGLSLTKKIRQLPAYAKTPIIMITTEQNKDDVVEALRSGINAYVIKPFTPEILKTKIESLLRVL